MELGVGDRVVYRNHGIGRITARRRQEILGQEQDVLVLEFAELTITLPLALAEAQLRPLADGDELNRVGDALGTEVELASRNWLSRRRDTLEKLVGGTPVELAQIVKEGSQRERLRAERGGKAQLSLGERAMFTKARDLLSDEVAQALDIEPLAADQWIDRHLSGHAS